MKQFDGLQSLQQPLSGLPQWVSERILQQILSPRRWQDESNDLWTTYQRIQENLIKGGLSGRSAKGGRTHTRAVRGIDGDVKLNRALWVMAEAMLSGFQS